MSPVIQAFEDMAKKAAKNKDTKKVSQITEWFFGASSILRDIEGANSDNYKQVKAAFDRVRELETQVQEEEG